MQKESILNVVKNFADANEGKHGGALIPKDIIDSIWKDREDYVNGAGKNYTREEVGAYVLRNQTK